MLLILFLRATEVLRIKYFKKVCIQIFKLKLLIFNGILIEERKNYAKKGVAQVQDFYDQRLETCDNLKATQIWLAKAQGGKKAETALNVALPFKDRNVVVLAPSKHHWKGSK